MANLIPQSLSLVSLLRMSESPGDDYLKESRKLIADRILYENTLLNNRTGHPFTVHGLFATTLAITSSAFWANLHSRDFFRGVVVFAGLVPSGWHLLIGGGTLKSIRFWSDHLKSIEETLKVPAEHRFAANLSPQLHVASSGDSSLGSIALSRWGCQSVFCCFGRWLQSGFGN